MSYQWPEWLARVGDVGDPRYFNRSLLPMAQLIGGRLNEHNVRGQVFPATRVPTYASTYINPTLTEQGVNYWPAFAVGAGDPASGQANAIRTINDGEWHRVTGQIHNLTTGEDMLQVFALAQYVIFFEVALGLSAMQLFTSIADSDWMPVDWHPPRIQFAIRIDGVVIEHSITGETDLSFRPPWGMRKVTPKVGATGMLHVWRTVNAVAMGQSMQPVRVGCVWGVSEGSHTVELVYRRVLDQRSSTRKTKDDEDSFVEIGTRKMLTLQHRAMSLATGGSSTFSISAYEDGDTLTAASLGTNRLVALAGQLNALPEGALARGALNHQHLPSAIAWAAGTNTITPAVEQAISVAYQGYGANAGWNELDDGAGTNLRNTQAFDWTTTPALMVVVGNVHVKMLRQNDGSGGNNDDPWNRYGLLRIAAFNGAGVRVAEPAGDAGINEVMFNSGNPDQDDPVGNAREEDIHLDVPLLGIYDYRAASAAIASFRIEGCTHYAGTNTTMEHLNGGLSVFGIRP